MLTSTSGPAARPARDQHREPYGAADQPHWLLASAGLLLGVGTLVVSALGVRAYHGYDDSYYELKWTTRRAAPSCG